MEQLDIFGNAEAIDTPAAPAAPADEQLSLFRPDFTAMRAPKARKARKAAAAVALDPTLHTDALI